MTSSFVSARARSWCVALASSALVALAVTVESPAVAAEGDDAAQAFEQARKLWDAHDASAALPLFQKAVAATGSPNARLYVARCLRETGRLPEAYDELERTVRDARSMAETDERYAATRDTAAAELAILEGRIGKLVIALGPSLAGAAVTVAGAPLDAARVGKPIAVLPRDVRVVATSPSGNKTERTITVPAATTQAVTLSEEPAKAPAPTAPPATKPDDESGGGFGVVRGLGIGVAAVGVGGFAMFAVGTVQADDKLSTLEAECGAGPCTDPKYADVISSGKTMEIVAGVGLGVGIAGVAAGTLMLILGGPSEPDTTAAFEPTANGFRVRF